MTNESGAVRGNRICQPKLANKEQGEADLRCAPLRLVGPAPESRLWLYSGEVSIKRAGPLMHAITLAPGAMATTASNHYSILTSSASAVHSEPGSMQQAAAYRDTQSLLQSEYSLQGSAHSLGHAHQWITSLSHGEGAPWPSSPLSEQDIKPALQGDREELQHSPGLQQQQQTQPTHLLHQPVAHGGTHHDSRPWRTTTTTTTHLTSMATSNSQGMVYTQPGAFTNLGTADEQGLHHHTLQDAHEDHHSPHLSDHQQSLHVHQQQQQHPGHHEQSDEDTPTSDDLEQFAKQFKQRRIKLGFTQADRKSVV